MLSEQIPVKYHSLNNNSAMTKNQHWLQVEVCREFMRGNCSRKEEECRFAHPPEHVSAENGKVTACFDSMKSRCQREKCKYLHPPKHIKMQLEINGKNFQTQKNATQQILNSTLTFPSAQWVNTLAPFTLISDPSTFNTVTQENFLKADKMEVCRQFRRGNCSRGEDECRYAHPSEDSLVDTNGYVTVCMDFMKGRCQRESCKYFHPLPHLQAQVRALQQQQVSHLSPSNLMLEGNRKRSRDEKDDMVSVENNLYPSPKKIAYDTTQNIMASPFLFPGTTFTQPAFQQALTAMQFIPATLPLMQDLNATGFPVLQSQQPAPTQQTTTTNSEPEMQVCRDYEKGKCNRPSCKYAHVDNKNVSTMDGRVTICRDYMKGKCTRMQCKYYHMPVLTVPIVS